MTLSSETYKVIYTGDGSTTVFPYTFKILDETEILVTQYTISDGTETVLTLTTNYTVSGVGDAGGGNITLTGSAPSSSYKIILQRDIPLTQTADYVENDPFPAETHEEALDRLTMICQQLQEALDRAVVQDPAATAQITFPTPTASGYFYYDGADYSWTALTSSTYAGTITRGLDSTKSGSPSQGDVHFATDTNRTYVCYTGGTWTTTQMLAGANATKIATPDVNDIFFAVDTGTLYYCATDDVWTAFDAESTLTGAIEFVIDGGGSAITTGVKGDLQIPFACTINSVTLLADTSTTIVVDLWKDTYANHPPTDADSITASAVPTITADTKYTDATLTGWTTSVTADDIIRFNVDSNDNATRATVIIDYTRS